MDKLERKPIPSKKQTFDVSVAQQKSDVKLNMKLQDKTKEKKFDRKAFESNFKEFKQEPSKILMSATTVPTTKSSKPKSKPPSLKVTMRVPGETPAPSVIEPTSDAPEVEIKRKIGKLKLKSNLKGTITAISNVTDAARKTKPPKFGEVEFQPSDIKLGDEMYLAPEDRVRIW